MEGSALIGLCGIALLLAILFFVGIPVSFAMALVGILGISYLVSPKVAVTTAINAAWTTFSSYGFSAIPLFVLMGAIVFRCGISEKMFECVYKWMGHKKGGLAVSTLLACAGFAAVCGSNTATAATMSTVAIPEMKRYNYGPILTGGVIASGSTLGVVIPPSIVLIVYGLYTGQPISKLFIASIIPGMILTLLFMTVVWLIVWRRPEVAPAGPTFSWKQRIKALRGTLEIVTIFVLLMWGLYKGWFTPTEAGGAGTLFSMVIAAISGRLGLKRVLQAVEDTLRLTGMVLMILFGALVFGKFITLSGLPQFIASKIMQIGVSKGVLFAILIVIYIIGGAIMDALAFLLVTLPIVLPIALINNINPIWFGIWLNILTTMGAITPPVGVNAYIVGSIDPDITLDHVFRGILPFLPAYIVCLILMIIFPQVVIT